MFISAIAITGSAFAGYWGVGYYTSKQKGNASIALLAPPKPQFGLRNPFDMLGKRQKSLLETLTPDRFVPDSHKVQSQLRVADRSPWKDQVVTEQSTTTQSVSEKVKTQLRDLPLFARYARRYWAPYAVVSVVSVVGLMGPALYRLLFFAQGVKTIADSALVVGGGLLMKKALLKMIVGLPIAIGMLIFGERLAARLSSRMANDIRADLFAHLQNLPPAFHQEAKLSDLVARFSTDMEMIEVAMGKELLAGVSNLGLMVLSLGFMISMQWQLALLSLLPLIGMVPVMLGTAEHLADTGYGRQT